MEPAPFIAHSAELLKSRAPCDKNKKGFALPKDAAEAASVFLAGAARVFFLLAANWCGWTAAAVVAPLCCWCRWCMRLPHPIAARAAGLTRCAGIDVQGLGCDVPLPRAATSCAEYSELAAVPDQANLIRGPPPRNQAAYPQAYPHLELTLKDGEDRVLSRKVFLPLATT